MTMAKDSRHPSVGRLLRPVWRRQALQIAAQALARPPDAERLICHGTKPPLCRIYGDPPEPCWYIFAPWDDDNDLIALRSRRVILVGKLTGTIHYDGSAGDEG